MTRGIAAMRDKVSRLGRVVSMVHRVPRRKNGTSFASLAPLSLGMEMLIDALRDRLADPLHPLQIGEPGPGDAARRSEMMQQRLLAPGADAGDLVKRRAADRLGAARAMRADGEAVGLVAQPLEVVEHGVARIEAEGLLSRPEKALAPGIAVGTFGDRHQRDVVDAEIG